MQLLEFLQELFLGFGVVGVLHRCSDGANLRTSGGFKPANALGALIGIDYVRGFALADGVVLALGFTSAATDAVFSDFVRHVLVLPPRYDWMDYCTEHPSVFQPL